MQPLDLWQRYREWLCVCDAIGLHLDVSRMHFDSNFIEAMQPKIDAAFAAMDALEAGAIANPDEGRRVGHYWLRAPELAPEPALRQAIETCIERVKTFTADIHEGRLRPPNEERFTDLLVIGIGGSALGPQLVADALGEAQLDRMRVHFLDNTDPDGMDRTIQELGERLASTLVLVISKSGGTPETRNGMLYTKAAFADAGLDFPSAAVAITGEGSQLDHQAENEGWLARFPMWDWVGGRTSVTSAVGLLPAALQGLEIDDLIHGARDCDALTRVHDLKTNPAALMALMWYHATDGKGTKDLVILPYKDRLMLLSRYLQQLIMESLGKAQDLQGQEVKQGLTVYGNKGSTDQHAYVQQLRDGVDNFFVTFVDVLRYGGESVEVEAGVGPGDYLHGFLLGTRQALFENGRPSMTLTVDAVDEYKLGVLIALFERAVGFYASLVGINAYHQPGVEAGKKAAAQILQLRARLVTALQESPGPATAEELAAACGEPEAIETILSLLEHLCANSYVVAKESGPDYFSSRYSYHVES